MPLYDVPRYLDAILSCYSDDTGHVWLILKEEQTTITINRLTYFLEEVLL